MAKELIDYALEAIKDLIQATCHEVFDLKSLWLLRHVPERKTWKSWKYVAIDGNVKDTWNEDKSLQDEVGHKEIPELLGSIGRAFTEFKESEEWLFIPNTFKAPEGTVIEMDLRLGHQSVWFIPFCDDKDDVVSFLLVSLKLNKNKTEDDVKGLKEILEERLFLRDSGEEKNLGSLVRLAYANKCLEEKVNDFKELTIQYDFKETPKAFLEKALLDPLMDFVRGTSVLPVIKIEGKQLKEPLTRYSDVVYDRLKQVLQEAVRNGSESKDVVVGGYQKHLGSRKVIIYEGKNVRIKYCLFHNNDCDIFDSIQLSSTDFNMIQDSIIKHLDLDDDTLAVVEKKFITERFCLFCETINKDYLQPFYIVLDSVEPKDGKQRSVSFDKELIACDIKDYVENSGLDMTFGFHNRFECLEGDKELIITILTDSKENPFKQNQFIKEFIDQRYLYYKIIVERRRALQESIKSAKAAIMSRNLSHNLGSHVMSYLKQNFNSAQEMVASGSLEDVIGKETDVATKELPLLVGMGKFISYLQERQDYIATVSTDYIPYPSVVNFKDAIYDELNPDYRYQRHKDNWTGHKPVNILLQNIAKSEGLSREVLVGDSLEVQKENNILIMYRDFNGLNSNNKADYDALREWNFALPGGSMGRQAFFSIVENVIRNAAKHGVRTQGESLIIKIDIIDPLDPKFNARMETEFKDYVGKTDDLYIVTLTDNVTTPQTDIDKINEVLEHSFYKDGDDLQAKNKGLKEMLISAAWLRSIRIEESQDNADGIAPIMTARSDKGCLQYVFCVPKVKEVALIVKDDDPWLIKKTDEVWRRKGWYVFTLEQYKKQNKNFNFVILKDLKDKKEEVRRISSSRFFVASNETVLKDQKIKFDVTQNSLDSESDLEKAEEILFKELASIDEGFKITIFDKKDEPEKEHVEAYDIEESIASKRYIYRKHNDTDKEFVDFLNSIKKNGNLMEALNRVEFIEGITGGNSTDRLLRHNDRNPRWVYQHAHAMKTKVAIFDERIFTRITGYEMSQLKEGEPMKINWEAELDGLDDIQVKQKVNLYDSKHNRKKSTSQILNASKEELIQFVQDNYPFSDPIGACEITKIAPLVYTKKGIDVYTFTRIDEKGTRFAIWGARFELNDISTDTRSESVGGEGDKWKNNKYGYVEKVAELFFKEVEETILKSGEEVKEKRMKPEITFFEKGAPIQGKQFAYDYLSIHQGLLDKIYEMKSMTVEEKQGVTKTIHKHFVGGNCDDGEKDYLRGLSIHSGRSKPNKDDMPQHQPFIQYSSIENAVADCKYTLVELLDFACYEQ